jgi:HptB-dependent secretion and biofilm anti anti-sigma factor
MDSLDRPLCIALRGEFDLAERPGLDAALTRAADASCVVLDLAQTTYLDSSAIGAFILLRRSVAERPGGGVALARVGPQIARIVEIAGLSGIFPCFDSLEAAYAYFEIDPATVRHESFDTTSSR